MTLKRVLIDLLSAEQLREFCTAFEIEADRRSADAMRDGIARAKRAKPEPMIERMTVDQLRSALESYDQPTTGNRPELVARLLEAGGLVISYRKEGVAKKYLPDFVVELESGEKLIIEIKGQVGDALIKKAAAERWCRAVTNLGRFGVWKYHLCFGQSDLEAVFG